MNKTVLSILICAMAVSACKEKSGSRNAAVEQKGAEIVTDKTVSGSGTQRNATLNRYQANSATTAATAAATAAEIRPMAETAAIPMATLLAAVTIIPAVPRIRAPVPTAMI